MASTRKKAMGFGPGPSAKQLREKEGREMEARFFRALDAALDPDNPNGMPVFFSDGDGVVHELGPHAGPIEDKPHPPE